MLDQSPLQSGQPLHSQVRRRLVEAIANGSLRHGARLPSSRAYARALGVSRNTVANAYAALIADGHAVGHERSGLFVATARAVYPGLGGVTGTMETAGADRKWSERLRASPPIFMKTERAIDFDLRPRSLAPDAFAEPAWREAVRLSLTRRGIARWTVGDDPMLVEEIRTKVLGSE